VPKDSRRQFNFSPYEDDLTLVREHIQEQLGLDMGTYLTMLVRRLARKIDKGESANLLDI